jgi:hypothetical protein
MRRDTCQNRRVVWLTPLLSAAVLAVGIGKSGRFAVTTSSRDRESNSSPFSNRITASIFFLKDQRHFSSLIPDFLLAIEHTSGITLAQMRVQRNFIAGEFSLHAGVGIAPNQREKLERLCRYVSRPPASSERLAVTASGQVRYTLKTPVPGWHYPHRGRAAGSDGSTGGAGCRRRGCT